MKIRLDQYLVQHGLIQSRERAKAMIMSGVVFVNEQKVDKAGEMIKEDAKVEVRGHDIGYVSRGGLKLEKAMQCFPLTPNGKVCMDIGASTGGFTDCLLRRGASSVLSVDVGYAQFDWALRQDARVTLMERTNIVDVPAAVGASYVDLAVCDVSFTSVTMVLPAVMELLRPHGAFLTLVKPQFEAAREDVGEGGVVRDQAVRDAAIERVRLAFEEAGLNVAGVCESPIHGHKGNVEYLLLGTRG